MLLSENETKRLTQKILSFVTADDARVSVNSETRSHLRFAANDILTSGSRVDFRGNVTVWIAGKRGSAATNALDADSLKAMVAEAEKIASTAPIDQEYVPTLSRQKYEPTKGYVEATANLSFDDRAKAVGEIISECEKKKVIVAGFHETGARAGGNATKHGNFEYERSTSVSLSTTVRTADGSSSGYFKRSHFDMAKLDTKRIANEAIRKALESQGAKPIDPGVYTVILEPQAVADLVGRIDMAFNARSADEGRSVFSAPEGKTRLGEKFFDEKVTLLSDPWHPEVPGSQAANEGIPAQRINLIKDGVIETLVYNRYWAKEKGKTATPGPVNLIWETSGATSTIEEMIKSTERGILVGRFWYIRPTDMRTASVTGLTRDGVWLIENGKIAFPLQNFRFNQSITKMLSPGNVLATGKPERVDGGGGSSLLPALKLKEFTFTSQSEAV